MEDELIDDLANCEASPYALAVDHFSIAMANDLIVREDIRDVSQYTLTDAYHALYTGKPELFENPDPAVAAWWREFFHSGPASTLRAKTVGNHLITCEACVEVARSLDAYLKLAPPDSGGDDESFESLRKRINSVRVTAEAADGVAQEAICAAQSLHSGVCGTLSKETIQQAERMVKRSATLRKILDVAGAMLKYRKGAKKRKIDGFDKVSTITQSGDLTKLLPTEIMQLAGPPVLAANTMRRLVENQTLAMKRFSYERAGKGPIVVIVDESGSMDGEPIEQAKGLALAMANVAKEQKRWICLVGFGIRSQFNQLVMPPDQWDVIKLLKWLEHFYSGGTDFDVLRTAMRRWDSWGVPKGKADVLFVTDGCAYLGDDLVRDFAKFKQDREVQCYGMAIGTSLYDLPRVCDKAWTTATMGMESSAVREVLTL